MIVACDVRRLCREEHTLPHGRSADFEIVRHSGGAAILPILPDGQVLLLRQFRPTIGTLVSIEEPGTN